MHQLVVTRWKPRLCGADAVCNAHPAKGGVPTNLLDMLDLRMAVFHFFQLSCGMSYAIHKKGNNELAILVFLTFLALLVVVF